jgi:hypothetical protein
MWKIVACFELVRKWLLAFSHQLSAVSLKQTQIILARGESKLPDKKLKADC